MYKIETATAVPKSLHLGTSLCSISGKWKRTLFKEKQNVCLCVAKMKAVGETCYS